MASSDVSGEGRGGGSGCLEGCDCRVQPKKERRMFATVFKALFVVGAATCAQGGLGYGMGDGGGPRLG